MFGHLSFIIYFASVVLAIWPLPSFYEHGVGVVWIAPNLTFSYSIANQVFRLVLNVWPLLT